jgi:hypothetical protein
MLSAPSAENAFRVDSVLAMTRASGPAAARRPLDDATLKSDAVDGGSWDEGHGDGSSRIFESPASDKNPSAYIQCTI